MFETLVNSILFWFWIPFNLVFLAFKSCRFYVFLFVEILVFFCTWLLTKNPQQHQKKKKKRTNEHKTLRLCELKINYKNTAATNEDWDHGNDGNIYYSSIHDTARQVIWLFGLHYGALTAS